jgi:hypothetical protein
VLERAAADAEAIRGRALPTASLSLPTILATLRVPLRLWTRRTEYKEEQLAVSLLVDEFRRTGAVQENVPVEVDIVHRVVGIHQAEQRWAQEREERLASQQIGASIDSAVESTDVASGESPATIPFAQPDTRREKLSHSDTEASLPTDPSIRRGA